MPALSVSVDGQLLATVSSDDGYDMLDLRVNGSRIQEEFATLCVSGGSYPEEGESTYHLWIDHLLIQPGQVIAVELHDQGVTSFPGKTIDDLYPDEPEKSLDPTELPTIAEIVAELKQRPNLREQYTLRLVDANSQVLTGQTLPEEASFTFSVMWHALHHDTAARISLHSGTLDRLLDRGPFNYHARLKLHTGESVSVQFDTLAAP